MSQFSTKVLLSSVTRKQCIENVKNLPLFHHNHANIKQTASVLVPLCEVDGEVSILYTLRSENLNSHRGQVSFPGGMSDDGENVLHTALRETEEELGLSQDQVDVWCQMPGVQGRNKNLLVTPVVGLIKNYNPLILKPNAAEVAEVFTVSIRTLCDKSIHGYLPFENVFLPVYAIDKFKIWGITAFITHLFLQCLLPDDDIYSLHISKKYEVDELMPSKL